MMGPWYILDIMGLTHLQYVLDSCGFDKLQLHMSSLVHFGELPILNVLKWNNQWEQSVAPMKGTNYKNKARTIGVGTY